MWSRALHGVEWSARHTWARYNKSLDASGVSELVIDNLSVTWLTAAASTQPLSRFAFETAMQQRSVVMQLDGTSNRVLARAVGYGMF